MPDVRETLEVCSAILAAVRVVPKAERHRRERRRAHELAFLLADGAAVGRENFDLHAEPAALQLTAMHRPQRIAEREARDQVGAAGNRGQLNVGFDAAVNEIEARRRERRACRQDRAKHG
jgi:hypothetical protein